MAFLGSICGADQVRSVIGLDSDELQESTVLSRAVGVDIAVKQKIPEYQTIIDNQATDPEPYSRFVDYVVHVAAYKVLPSVALTLEQKVKDDSGAEGSRYGSIEKHLAALSDYLKGVIEAIESELNGTTAATLNIMGRSVPTIDVVTGQ